MVQVEMLSKKPEVRYCESGLFVKRVMVEMTFLVCSHVTDVSLGGGRLFLDTDEVCVDENADKPGVSIPSL